jgi:hypothetical protein
MALVRAGRVYPVALVDALGAVAGGGGGGRLGDLAVVEGGGDAVSPVLRERGAARLRELRRRRPELHDGPVLRWLAWSPAALVVTTGSYFDMIATCDALRAEWLTGTAAGSPPLRETAREAAGGDPLGSGVGRCAALGVTVVLTVPSSGSGVGSGSGSGSDDRTARSAVLGLRGGPVATDRGSWHFAPSGMAEPRVGGDAIAHTISAELHEELGVRLDPAEVLHRATVLGIAQDLLRLRPDLVVRFGRGPKLPASLRRPVQAVLA